MQIKEITNTILESQRNKNANLLWDLAIESIWKWNRLTRLKKAFKLIADQQGHDIYPLSVIQQNYDHMISSKSIFSKKNESMPSLAEYSLAYLIIKDIVRETRENELLNDYHDACLFSSYILRLLCRE